MSRYVEVKTAVDPELKERLYALLESEGVQVSDFIRSAAIFAIEQGRVPFDIKKRKPAKPGKYHTFKEEAALA